MKLHNKRDRKRVQDNLLYGERDGAFSLYNPKAQKSPMVFLLSRIA